MTTIKFKQLHINNFKGIVDHTIANFGKFNLEKPVLAGKNGIGKTTLLESLTYLFNKKNLQNKVFDIHSSTNPFNKATIKLILEVQQANFTGQVMLSAQDNYFLFNGLDLKLGDYKAQIQSTLGFDGALFQLLSVPQLFQSLTKSEQRELFMKNFLTADIAQKAIDETIKLWQAANNFTPEHQKLIAKLKLSKYDFTALTKTFNDANKFLATPIQCNLPPYKNYISKTDTELQALISADNSNEATRAIDAIKFKSNLKDFQKTNNQEIEKNTSAVAFLKNVRIECLKIINDHVKEANFDFNVELFEYDKFKTLKDTFEITKGGVDFGSLNYAERLKISIEIALLLQLKNEVSLPILLDNIESLDDTNINYLTTSFPNVQFIATKVKN